MLCSCGTRLVCRNPFSMCSGLAFSWSTPNILGSYNLLQNLPPPPPWPLHSREKKIGKPSSAGVWWLGHILTAVTALLPFDKLHWFQSGVIPISLVNSTYTTSSHAEQLLTSSPNEICFPLWGQEAQGSFSSTPGGLMLPSLPPTLFYLISVRSGTLPAPPSVLTAAASHIVCILWLRRMN